MKANIKFRPLERQTLELMHQVHQMNSSDAVATYSRLMSAAMLSAAILGLTQEQITQQVEIFAEQAIRAVSERKDIFGGRNA